MCDDYEASLDEGITDMIAELLDEHRPLGSYLTSNKTAQFLMYATGTNYEDYTRGGTNYILNKAIQLYPDVDSYYITSSLSTMLDATIFDNEVKILDDNKDMLDELFKICLEMVDTKKSYEPFNYFAQILNDVRNREMIFDYLELYNNKLRKLNYSSIIDSKEALNKFRVYKNISGVGLCNEEVFPVIQDENNYKKVEMDGSISDEVGGSRYTFLPILAKVSSSMFDNYETFGTKEYWNNLAKLYSLFSPHLLGAIPVYHNGNLIGNINVNSLTIKVGSTKDKEIGFVLLNQNDEVIFETAKELINLSDAKSFELYLSNFDSFIAELELNDVLNVDYLKKICRQNNYFKFNNIELNGDVINIKETEQAPVENKPINITENKQIVSIYDDEELIVKCSLDEVFLTIGTTKDNKMGFILANKMGEVLYKTSDELNNISNPVSFNYLEEYPLNKIYLSDYLNEEFIKKIVVEKDLFDNIRVKDNKLEIDNLGKIYLDDKSYHIKDARIYKLNNKVFILENNSNLGVSLEEVLRSANILQEGMLKYRLSEEYLINIFDNYLASGLHDDIPFDIILDDNMYADSISKGR